jgi:hypothetical protein
MPFGAEPLVLTEDERQELQQMTQSRTLSAGDVMRSRMILLLSDGVFRGETLNDCTALRSIVKQHPHKSPHTRAVRCAFRGIWSPQVFEKFGSPNHIAVSVSERAVALRKGRRPWTLC